MKWEFEEKAGARVCRAKGYPMATIAFWMGLGFAIVGAILVALASERVGMLAVGTGFVMPGLAILVMSFFANDPKTEVQAKDGVLSVSSVYRFSKGEKTFPLASEPTFKVTWYANPILFTPGGPDGGLGIWRLVVGVDAKDNIELGDSQSKDELETAAKRLNEFLCGEQVATAGGGTAVPRTDDIPQAPNVGVVLVALMFVMVGVLCCFWGYVQYQASKGCSPTPVEADLARLEAGEKPPDYHVKLGEHVAVYDGTLLRCRVKDGEPTPESKVSWAKYPIISRENPFFREIGKLAKKHGGVKSIPHDEYPDVKTFAVLVLTREWDRAGDVPDGFEKRQSVEGLIINTVAPLLDRQKELISERFPGMAVDEIWILEEGRRPYAMSTCYALIGGGILILILGGVIAVLMEMKRRKTR